MRGPIWKLVASFLGLISLSSAGVLAQSTPTMFPISNASGVEPKVINGERATREEWPVTLPFKPAHRRTNTCTGTVIGDRVVVTAAHCVGNNGQARVVLGNIGYKLTCTHHEKFRGAVCRTVSAAPDVVGCTADIALCLADKPIDPKAGKFERVRKLPPGATTGAELTLLGYGCTVSGGAMSEVLQVGPLKVEWTSTPGASARPQDTYKEYIKTHGSAAACKGDSGGAAYSNRDRATREILAINSRGHLSTDSYLVNVLDPHIAAFFESFGNRHRVKICGWHPDASNCRM
jgi:hypothetical protein